MAKKKAGLRDQVKALEALAGLKELDDAAAREVNGGIAASKPIFPLPPKLRRGTGAVAIRRGTGAIRFAGTGALMVRGTGAVAARGGKSA